MTEPAASYGRYSLEPLEVPRVDTSHRRIVTAQPAPEAVEVEEAAEGAIENDTGTQAIAEQAAEEEALETVEGEVAEEVEEAEDSTSASG